ncbi:phosphate ABC transporter permease PstA [Microbacterium sp. NPDC090007]|uniref:phosphate ABC transporter permease PstA n=1 Tax=Microbacterium sp. NPDC090007 TaxID=3364204 RepID=UPI0037FC9B3C
MTLDATLAPTRTGERDDVTRVIATASVPPPRRGRTVLPDPGTEPIGPRRRVRGTPAEERFDLAGALCAALAVATLLFGWLTPMTGGIGWAVVAYLAFIAIYALLIILRADRREVADRVMTVLLYSAGALLLAALVFVVAFTLVRGFDAVTHLNFFVETMKFAGPLDPLTTGGIAHAIVGTLIQISIALAIAVPLGIATAVFMNEIGGRFARFVRTISDAMTALPSIVAGLFIYAAVITLVTQERSGFAASLAITVMMLPIIIRASDVVLRLVPGNLREASYALGASRWRTVWTVVLPTSRSGLATAVILGTARGVGETSPVLLTSGVTAVMNTNPFQGAMISLPLQVFDMVKSPEPTMIARGFGAAATLIVLVLVLFIVARAIGGKGPGQLSPRRRRARAAASLDDLARIERRADRTAATIHGVPATDVAAESPAASSRHADDAGAPAPASPPETDVDASPRRVPPSHPSPAQENP